MLRSALANEHEHLNAQLNELAGLRQELQGLYEKTQAELQVTKSEAALERGLREAATADNVALRKWNMQLAEELSALLGHLQEEEDEVGAESRRDGRLSEEKVAVDEAAAASASDNDPNCLEEFGDFAPLLKELPKLKANVAALKKETPSKYRSAKSLKKLLSLSQKLIG